MRSKNKPITCASHGRVATNYFQRVQVIKETRRVQCLKTPRANLSSSAVLAMENIQERLPFRVGPHDYQLDGITQARRTSNRHLRIWPISTCSAALATILGKDPSLVPSTTKKDFPVLVDDNFMFGFFTLAQIFRL
jgi:hypothetical protein